jgi:N-methylhydantoinase B
MAQYVPGSEKFAARPQMLAEGLDRAAALLNFHDVDEGAIAAVDPLTYEVIRHRLWAITNEMGSALQRMSGSVIVTEINDFNVAIMDQIGDVAQVGLYNLELSASIDIAVKWTIGNRAENPGIHPGDMFISTDPWVGGGLHQNDVSLFAPIFVGDELFGWTVAVAHQADLGGVAPGSWSTQGRDVFWESLPLPPIKIVEKGVIREDIEDSYLRRSRVPPLIALDLRAKVGANKTGAQLIGVLIDKYGADTVKAVMRRMMNDAESRLRERLSSLPDGTWTSVAHQDSAREGDGGIYKIACELEKKGDAMKFDFRGTDPAAEGFINCTYSGLRAGLMSAILPMLCGDIPWATGGLMKVIEIVSDSGTLNDADFPSGVGKASVASGFATQSAGIEVIASMLDAADQPDMRDSAIAVPCGAWDLALLAGNDQHSRPFVSMLGDGMAAGGGAHSTRDGGDTAGIFGIPMGRIADAEMNEFKHPILYLWRREEVDSGGPGRFRGGVGASSCFVLHNAPDEWLHMVVSQSGKLLPQSNGTSGGEPANTGLDIRILGSDAPAQLARGEMPTSLEEIGGEHRELPPHLETELAGTDAYYMLWQGGGGYGDPLLRDPAAVAVDVVDRRVSPEAASNVYGVIVDGDGFDAAATTARRTALNESRGGVAKAPPAFDEHATCSHGARIDDNLVLEESGEIACSHCGTIVGDSATYLSKATKREGPPDLAGPQIKGRPEKHTDREVIYRQLLCPGCGVAFQSEIVPADEGPGRMKRPTVVSAA